MGRFVLRHRAVAVVAVVMALAGSACGSRGKPVVAPTSTTLPRRPTVVTGGTARFAEQPGASPQWIFPLTPAAHYDQADMARFQQLMYRPLYWFGAGQSPTLNTALSLAHRPVFTAGDTVVQIRLKPYKWSNGETVTSRDVVFWLNLLEAEKTNWGGYVPGQFPDNVVAYSAPNPTTVVLHLDRAYNPTWFTYNELSQITPLPLAWDKTSAAGATPTGLASSAPDTSVTGAMAVYDYLAGQSSATATYAANPLWQVVDGPWKLSAFSGGRATFVPNPSYSGPVKPTLSRFVEVPFATGAAELAALRVRAVDYGYLPYSSIGSLPVPAPVTPGGTAGASGASPASGTTPVPNGPGGPGASTGNVPPPLDPLAYRMLPWAGFGFGYMAYNFANPTVGPLLGQLYVRQALQHLVDQPAWISTYWRGEAIPSYGPVPAYPPNAFYTAPAAGSPVPASGSQASSTQSGGAVALGGGNPYPFDVAAAQQLLAQHGWTVTPGGADVCGAPGSGANQCGPGVAAGATLSLTLAYANDVPAVAGQVQALRSAALQAGIQLKLVAASATAVKAAAVACAPTQPSCAWQIADWGATWSYTSHPYPTAGQLFGSGAKGNVGTYVSRTAASVVEAAQTSPSQSALGSYQSYMQQQLPVVYQPEPYAQLSEIAATLRGVSQDCYLGLTPENWYYVR